MNKIKKAPFWVKLLMIYLCIVTYCLIFFLVGGKDIFLKKVNTSEVNEIDNIGEILDGDVIEESFVSEFKQIDSLELKTATYDRENTGTFNVSILNGSKVIGTKTIDMTSVVNGTTTITFDEPISVEEGKEYTLQLTSNGSSEGNAVTVYYGNSTDSITSFSVRGMNFDQKQLVCEIAGKVDEPLGKVLLGITIASLVALGIYIIHVLCCEKNGKMTVGVQLLNAYHQYHFLLQQLVSREFKVRYKRSALGVMWSFVNPLLTMIVQFFVFTLVFKSAIPNYIVYLIIGITFFNFFNEATTGGMLSIITNSALIKKVYVPKYIYPISQIFSSSINFGISLILMFGVSFVCGLTPNVYYFLIPFAIISVFVLNIGVALLLATGMTFFRDVQFIYNVFMTALTYATPMFWDMSMIPDKYNWIFKVNPMADIIIFVRDIVMNHQYPGTDLVLLMICIPVVFLLIGVHVFRKNQDKFILYI